MSAPAPRSVRARPVIDAARCTGCGWCISRCPDQLLTLEVVRWRKTSTLHAPELCTGCALCARHCPFGVIRMQVAGASDT